MTSPEYVRGCVSICTDESMEDPVYINVDNVKNLTIKMVENYGETGKFQIVNILNDPTKNLLSDQCTGWSDGQTRKIDQTMFARIYRNTNRDAANPIGVYKITTITASSELITVEFCDALQFLRSQGADYVYNHYEGGYDWHNSKLEWADNKAFLKKPGNVPLIGGLRKDVKVTYVAGMNEYPHNGNKMNVNHGITAFIPRSAYTGDYLKRIENIYMEGLTPTSSTYYVKVSQREGGNDILDDRFTQYANFNIEYTFNVADNPEKYYVPKGFWIWINTDHWLAIDTYQATMNGAKTKWGESQSWWYDRSFKINIITEKETDDVEGAEDSTDHTKWIVNSADGISMTSGRVDSWEGSAKIYYSDPVGDTPNTKIIHDIVMSTGMTVDIPMGMAYRNVSVFRCNGDYIHNYILALADMPNTDSRQFTLYADRSEWGKINVRTRFNTEDTPLKSLAYAKDGVAGADEFMSFNPSLSLKNRPNMAVVKSSDESDHPVMVALIDPQITIGSTQPLVSSNSTDVATAMMEAYSSIITNRSNQWSGEMKLPYIIDEYFKRDDAGECGGIPISITDSRYGFADYRAKVKEVEWDFANQTTTITINNYSEMYSNGLVDTTKMAYTSGGLSAESTNTDMFTRQFVNLKSDMTYEGTEATVSLIDRLGSIIGTADPSDVALIKIPELNTGVINAYFPYGSGTTSERHGIYAVKVNDTIINIDQYRRPDKAQTESLIVNILYRLT